MAAVKVSDEPNSQDSGSMSSETVDLAGDLDLEAQLESKVDEKSPSTPPHGPSTLAPDDPSSLWIFSVCL
jgi:hypothetical protein